MDTHSSTMPQCSSVSGLASTTLSAAGQKKPLKSAQRREHSRRLDTDDETMPQGIAPSHQLPTPRPAPAQDHRDRSGQPSAAKKYAIAFANVEVATVPRCVCLHLGGPGKMRFWGLARSTTAMYIASGRVLLTVAIHGRGGSCGSSDCRLYWA
ncbi:hypothetical protein ACRALDRAFT_2061362 [Sodiomyces alcalophilus JCM 7366]|uniref:uncharacterized protein n=1 Tax=Sodiomyces alcalophilus JCM 7366 TaxID=591952 RepID=UPI0039B59569